MLRQNAKSVYDQVCFRQPYGPGFGYGRGSREWGVMTRQGFSEELET